MKSVVLATCLSLLTGLQAFGQTLPQKKSLHYMPTKAKIDSAMILFPTIHQNRHHISDGHATGTVVIIDGVLIQNFQEGFDVDYMNMPECVGFPKTPLPLKETITRTDIDKLPYNDIKDIIASRPFIFQMQRGSPLNIHNGGEEGTLYVIDHMVMMR